MYKDRFKLLAAVLSASMIACSTSVPAAAKTGDSSISNSSDISTDDSESIALTTEISSDQDSILKSTGNTISISDTGIDTGETGVIVSESDDLRTVKISENGIYDFTGSGSSVVISIDKGLEVTLGLSDLDIDNTGISEDNGFIETGAGTTLNIELNGDAGIEGGANAISAKKESTVNISGEGTLSSVGALDGAISAKYGEINISSGTVNIEDNGDDAIKAKGGAINILGGSINIKGSKGDGLKAKYDSESSYSGTNGLVRISGGTVNIEDCEGDGIQAENVDIEDGTLNISTWFEGAAKNYYSESAYSEGSDSSVNYLWESGDSVKYERVNVDIGSHKGIKAGTKEKIFSFSDDSSKNFEQESSGSLKISGGNITIDTTKSGLKANSVSTSGYSATKSGKYIIGSPDDAISCGSDIEITGGTIKISSSDDGISSLKTVNVTGDTRVTINTSYEGIEAQSITVGDEDGSDEPVITIESADDGINTSGKTLYYTYDTYEGYEEDDEVNYIKTSESSSTGNNMTVNSGNVTINIDSEGTKNTSLPDGSLSTLKTVTFRSSGDGIDCNGSLTQNGGGIFVYGQASGDNSPIDTNSGFTFNSGSKLLGTGSDGMNESAPKSGTGTYITYGGNGAGNKSGFEMPGNSAFPEGPDGSASGNGFPGMQETGTPPQRPDGSASGNGFTGMQSGNTPPEAPGNDTGEGGFSGMQSGSTPPETPGNNTGEGGFSGMQSGSTPPELLDNDTGEGGFSGMQGNMGSSLFSAGDYWVVVDSEGNTVDYGELKNSGSFIIYGSDLISDGSYSLAVTGSVPVIGEKAEISEESITDPASGQGESEGSEETRENDSKTDASNTDNQSTGETGSSVSENIIKGYFTIGDNTYEYQYTDTLSYNGKKLTLSDLTINGKKAGNTLSGNVIFKSVKYKNNKAVGAGKAILKLKAARGADAVTKKAVKEINRQFKSNPLSFSIVRGSLDERNITGKAVYNSSTGKWRLNLKQKNSDGTVTKLKYKANGKGDFTVDTSSLDLNAGTVDITGVNNYTGTVSIPVTVS